MLNVMTWEEFVEMWWEMEEGMDVPLFEMYGNQTRTWEELMADDYQDYVRRQQELMWDMEEV